jgi:F420-dependent oxidoreductase-like protein
MGTGCFVSVGRSVEQAVRRVKMAEELGYEACYVTHIAARDSLAVCLWYAAQTTRIRLGTGVVPIYTRTPAAMAQEAATIDELSGGRFTLGLGVSHRPVVEAWHGQTIDKPLAEMREYLGSVRAILRGEEPNTEGKWPTRFRLAGMATRPDQPLYVAALSPKMLRLAGEIADGVILWLCTHQYVRDVVVPEVTRGREKAGRSLDGFDIVAAVPSAHTDDPGRALDQMRADAQPYFGLPFYRAMIERSGFSTDEVTDEFLSALTAIGSEEDVRAGLQAYRDAGATSPCVSPIARTDLEATLHAAAPA